MAGYNGFFIVGLLVIGFVAVYTDNHGDLPAQQSNKRENLKATFDGSLLTIEKAAAGSATDDAPRILTKRSDPNRHRGVPKDHSDATLPEELKNLQRESAELSAQRRIYQKAQEKAARRTLRLSEKAMKAQQQASQTKASQSGVSGPSQDGRNPGPTRH